MLVMTCTGPESALATRCNGQHRPPRMPSRLNCTDGGTHLLDVCHRVDTLDQCCRATEEGARAGGIHQALGLSLLDGGAAESDVTRELFDGEGLSRQGCLVYLQPWRQAVRAPDHCRLKLKGNKTQHKCNLEWGGDILRVTHQLDISGDNISNSAHNDITCRRDQVQQDAGPSQMEAASRRP